MALFALTLVNCKLVIDKHFTKARVSCIISATVLAQSFVGFDNSNCSLLTVFRTEKEGASSSSGEVASRVGDAGPSKQGHHDQGNTRICFAFICLGIVGSGGGGGGWGM